MNCPNCYTKIPDNQATCERCGWPDLAEKTELKPATPRSKQAPSMPMTGKQRWYHFIKALFPLLFALVPIIGIFTLVSPKNFTLIPLLIVIGLIVAATYFNKDLHDLVNSVVYVESDQLLKVDRFYGHKGSIIYMAFFKRLGDFQVDQEIYNTVELQSFYRVMYSQKSKKLWKVKLESNQAVLDNVLSEKQISYSPNEGVQGVGQLSLNQRKEIIVSIVNFVIFMILIYLFLGSYIKRLLWNSDNASIGIIVSSVILFIFLNLFKGIVFQVIDFITGKVESTIDTFIDFDKRHSNPGVEYTAKFQKLGKVSVKQQHYLELVKGEKYQLFYSRWSKIVWDVQKINEKSA
ncbi:MAG TPA: hypothetical protein DEF47_03060 [Herpetosiphon sp.]|nr:hypothetical protein [Herpetosiphon sp.]